MFITPSFKKSLIVEQFQGNYLNVVMYVKNDFDGTLCVIIFQPNVRVLNYAPGPLLTDMFETIRTTCGNHEVVEMFNTSKEEVSITVFMLPYIYRVV